MATDGNVYDGIMIYVKWMNELIIFFFKWIDS